MIRMATAADAEAAGRIYDPIVERTAISFELDPPGPAEMERRIGGNFFAVAISQNAFAKLSRPAVR